jgi:hypothetical protein
MMGVPGQNLVELLAEKWVELVQHNSLYINSVVHNIQGINLLILPSTPGPSMRIVSQFPKGKLLLGGYACTTLLGMMTCGWNAKWSCSRNLFHAWKRPYLGSQRVCSPLASDERWIKSVSTRSKSGREYFVHISAGDSDL